jgi:hypothetical protein
MERTPPPGPAAPAERIEGIVSRLAALGLGKSAVRALTAHFGRIDLGKYRRHRRRLKVLRREFGRDAALLEDLVRAARRQALPEAAPVALVSQIQRSGGSLLSQLFDGHPQLLAHPYELKIGFPKKHLWPMLDLSDAPRRWFEVLFEDHVAGHFRNGYRKGRQAGPVLAFILPPALQARLFLEACDAARPGTPREVLDAYFRAFFAAWLNRADEPGDKKFITAFTPRIAQRVPSIEAFFADYPDGRLISILRAPDNWYPSARRHSAKYADLPAAVRLWQASARAMVRNRARFGDRVCLIRFEDLVGRTEAVMRHLARFLGIDFHPCLLAPTFNRVPIAANTSFAPEEAAVMTGTLERRRLLSPEERAVIDGLAGEDYRRACAAAVCF